MNLIRSSEAVFPLLQFPVFQQYERNSFTTVTCFMIEAEISRFQWLENSFAACNVVVAAVILARHVVSLLRTSLARKTNAALLRQSEMSVSRRRHKQTALVPAD